MNSWLILEVAKRLAGLVVWIATGSFSQAFDSTALPVIGILLAPLTTGAVMAASLHADGCPTLGWKLAIAGAALLDAVLNLSPHAPRRNG